MGKDAPQKRKLILALPPYAAGGVQADCWARALTSWINQMTNPVELHSVEELLKRYAEKTNGGTMMKFDDLKNICKQDWGMKAEYIGGANFTWDWIYQILAEGMTLIYLAYPISPTLAHALVVYGIGGLESSNYTIFVMDPLYAYQERQLSPFQNMKALLVGFLDRKGTLSFPGQVT